jgi:flavorubredoxin
MNHSTRLCNKKEATMETRIDHITGGIYRIATMTAPYGITFNQFLIDDEQPTLIHTGNCEAYESVRGAIREVLDPATLANVVLLHWEGDENGGMDRFLAEAPRAELVGSALSIDLNAKPFGFTERISGFMDGQRLELGRHTLRFLETPHVHHWDSMMVFEESTASLFPSDLFLQPGDQPPIVTENLADAMCDVYRNIGIFAHEDPVREVVDRIEGLDPAWTFAMHGGSLPRGALTPYVAALREQDFAWEGKLLGRELTAPAAA